MPHLAETWKERREADRGRQVARHMHDRRFQWTRTRGARRFLSCAALLLLLGIFPGFVLAGPTVGIVVTGAAWAGWWLLRLSVRTLADLPDRFLDERQRALRDHSYFYAYLVLGWIVAGLATIGVVAFTVVAGNDIATVTVTWNQGIGAVLTLTLLISLLPSVVVAWLEGSEDETPIVDHHVEAVEGR